MFRQLLSCVTASAASAGIDPWMVPRSFTRDCNAACPGLEGYAKTPPGGESWRSLATGCHLFCSDAARQKFEAATPSHRWSELARACGAESYGLRGAQASLLSEVWFVVHTIGDWLAHAATVAGPHSRLALDDIAKTLPRVRWVLPLPATIAGRYDELPLGGLAFDDVFADDYVIVEADRLSMGGRPEAKLTVDGAKLESDWPGQRVPLAALGKRQEAFRRPVPPPTGANRGVLGPPPSPADATLARVRASAPLLLADANLPAARLVAVLEALGENGGRLGVTDGKGKVGEHLVLMTAQPIAIGAPTSRLVLNRGADPLSSTSEQPRGVAVWINVADATVRQLGDAMNRLYDGGVRLVVFDHGSATAPATPAVHGTLDKEVIRGVIRQHLAEVRSCYESGLRRQRDLYGRVQVQFTISGNGPVIAAIVESSTVNDAAVEGCITAAVKTWVFPKPSGGGIVIVTYPFVLKSTDAP